LAADAPPPAVQQEGNFYTASIPVRSDLTWTDGSAFTADDIVFTVNTVLSFQLGFDWLDHYNSEWLDHAEATGAHTVKFYFKKMPNIAVWQYGVLLGPVLQKAYWAPRIADSAALLPKADIRLQIESLKSKVSVLQSRVDALHTILVTATGDEARQAQASLLHQQGDLDKAINDLTKAKAASDNGMEAARTMLYSLNDQDEPRLGTWVYKASGNGWIENEADPNYPFGHPGLDRVTYRTYSTEAAARTAYLNGEVDEILIAGGLSKQSLAGNPSLQTEMKSSNHSLRFLVFNPLFSALNDPAVREAFACMIDLDQLVGQLNGSAVPLASYVLPAETLWNNTAAALPCTGLDDPSRIGQAVQILKSAGYSWKQEPAANTAGQKLIAPDGATFPIVTMIVPSEDNERATAASYIQHQMHLLGITLTVQTVSDVELNYSVLGSQSYETALLGWHVGVYPGYLCDWFGVGNRFNYSGNRIRALCASLGATSDLNVARQQIFEIQAILAQELPFVPLYSGVTVDTYQNVTYPFEQVPDGLSGGYGVPALANPVK
jgi:ABC-type transport system substrate-binding protein